MKNRVLSMLLVLVMMLGMMSTASATTAKDGTTSGKTGYYVSFTGTNPMPSNFTGNMDDYIHGMQPGDSAEFHLELRNEYNATTDWYMLNEVIKSLEDYKGSISSGGAYEYYLSYFDRNGKEHLLYDTGSSVVGGSQETSIDLQGLNEATNGLDEFFYLDTLEPGQTGEIYLKVSLEGETQGNSYQDTQAQLQMQFAVELPQQAPPAPETPPETPRDTPPGTPVTPEKPKNPETPNQPDQPDNPSNPDTSKHPSKKAVKTGDDFNIVPYVIAMGVSGLLLLVLAIYSLKKSKKKH